MPERVDELFAEYAGAYARGERPNAHEYLRRAGDAADVLAPLLDGFLARARRLRATRRRSTCSRRSRPASRRCCGYASRAA